MALAAGAVTLAQLNLPDEAFWDAHIPELWISAGVLVLFTAVDAVWAFSAWAQAGKIRDYDRKVRGTVNWVLVQVIEATGAPWQEVEAHYYRVRGFGWWRRLRPIVASRAGVEIVKPATHRPGSGLVGYAYSTRSFLTIRWQEFVELALDEGPEKWETRPAAQRYGLAFGQLQRTRPGELAIASPTCRPDGKPDGCLLISGNLKVEDDQTRRKVRETLGSFSGAMDDIGRPPAGWWSVNG